MTRVLRSDVHACGAVILRTMTGGNPVAAYTTSPCRVLELSYITLGPEQTEILARMLLNNPYTERISIAMYKKRYIDVGIGNGGGHLSLSTMCGNVVSCLNLAMPIPSELLILTDISTICPSRYM